MSAASSADSPAKRARTEGVRVCTGDCDREEYIHGVLTVVENTGEAVEHVVYRNALICAPRPPESLLEAITSCNSDETDLFGEFESKEAEEEGEELDWDAPKGDEDYVEITPSMAKTAWFMLAAKVARFWFHGSAAINPIEVLERFFEDSCLGNYKHFVDGMTTANLNSQRDLTNVWFNVRLTHNVERY